jgi:hypothetical protein
MPTVEEEYDKRYGKTARSKKKPKTGIPGGKSPLSPSVRKKKKKKTGVIESIKAIGRGLMKKTKERTGSEAMYEKHKRRRTKK